MVLDQQGLSKIMFKPYQHLEKLNTVETQGISDGECYVFPKIDGTNGSIWLEDNEICCGSRTRKLSIEHDNAGFCSYILQQENIKEFFKDYPDVVLYGEWLVKHSLKTYRDSAWRKFYVFDVRIDDAYLLYTDYSVLLEKYNIDFIPVLCKVKNPIDETLFNLLETNTYLIKDNEGVGEGIVVKNYNYVNKFGRITWAKIVRNEFKDKHRSNLTFKVRDIKNKLSVEQKIVDKYLTESLIEKEYSKIALNGWSSKDIPKLIGILFYTLIKEDSFNFVKEFKNPIIDFKELNKLVTQRIKEVKSELF